MKKSRILFEFMKFFDIGMMHIPLGGMFIAVYRKFYRAPSMTVCVTRLLLLIEDVDETTGAGSALGLLAINFNKEVQCSKLRPRDPNIFAIVLRNEALSLLHTGT